jgi:uncharacterized protein
MNPIEIIRKYYPADSEAYRILVEHSREVADKALHIVRSHPEMALDCTFIDEAAMLHDIGVFLCYAPKIHCFGSAEYICHGYLGAELLRAEGLPRHALVCERHTGTGLSLEMIRRQNLPLPCRDMRPQSLEEQLICYADKFFGKTKLHREQSLKRIRRDLAEYGNECVESFDEWHRRFGPVR